MMIIYVLGAAVSLAAAPLAAGIIKKCKARLQNRRGAPVLQPYYDISKLLSKDGIVSPTTSWVFYVAPYAYFASAVAAAGLAVASLAESGADFFLLIYLLALGRFCLALASLDAGSTFGGMGGSREMFIAVLVEPALLLALLTVALPAQTTSLASMGMTAGAFPLTLPYVLSLAAFLVVAIAETGRIPVDNPDTHLELTMVHEGMVLEYAGRELALIHWASMVKQFIILILLARFFVPWLPYGDGWVAMLLWLAVKVVAGSVVLAVAETSTNKMRLFKLPGLLAVSGLLSVLALVAQ